MINKKPLKIVSTPSLYLIVIFIFILCWGLYMTYSQQWYLFEKYWSMTLTMVGGSFVAGATAEGGAAIAFPVFTKVFHIPSQDARTFGLMIQSIGMTAAAMTIVVKKIRVLPKVIIWVSLGGMIGMPLGTFVFNIPGAYAKILFTSVAVSFGVALAISRWVIKWTPKNDIPNWRKQHHLLFSIVGIFGGIFAANTGSGIDMLTFIILTLSFGINEKISTPTTVIIMALNSIVGFFIHGFIKQDIGIVWNYWLVCIPVVVIGAPFGALVGSKIPRDYLILFLICLISIELITTIWLVPFTSFMLIMAVITTFFCIFGFYKMVQYRKWLYTSV